MFLRSALVLLALALVATPDASAAVRVTTAVEYGTARVADGSAPLLLDLYRPAKATSARRPVVVLIHGGGFKQQSRKDPGMVRIARALANRGIVAASIDYRLMPQGPVPSSRVKPLLDALPKAPISTAMVAAVDDTLTAISYLKRRRSALDVDVRRLGVAGASAGAITADHVAYALDDHGITAPKVRFAASLWGGLVIPPGVRQLDRGEAALFAAHGTEDSTVKVAFSDQLAARARKVGVQTEYHRMRGLRHGFNGSKFFTTKVVGSQTAFDRLLRFASARLRRQR